MIIKSMSRKSKSFSQLYDYLTRDKSSHTFSRNTYTNSKNKKEFVNEFYDNARHLRDARGKVYMYHEVLSLEENNLSKERQREILLDMAEKYLFQRADEHLAFGVVHEEKNNMHLHLMISANEIEGDRRVRLSKREFKEIQQRLENYKNQKYSELTKSFMYSNEKDLSKSKQNEQELKNRGAKSIKDEICKNMKDIFSKATSKKYLENRLNSLGYKFYTRGKTQGINFNGKNYRLKTLKLDTAYQQLLAKLNRIQEREIKRSEAKQEKSNTRTQR
jgi:hypothetical protein